MLKQSEYNFNKLTIHLRYSVLRFNYQQSIHCTYIPIRDILNLVLRFHKQLLLYIVIVHAAGAKRFPLLMIQLSIVTHSELSTRSGFKTKLQARPGLAYRTRRKTSV